MEENSDNSDTEMPKRNIELIITDQPTEVINTENALYHDILEKEIPDTAYTFSVKINDVKPEDFYDSIAFSEPLLAYLTELTEDTQHWSVTGLHENGRNKIPHIHIHYITSKPITALNNSSQHRDRWAKKHGCDKNEVFRDVSFSKCKPIDLKTPKYQFLSYALKEGKVNEYMDDIYYAGNRPMKPDLKEFLRQTGLAIYNVEQAQHFRDEKREERQQNEFKQLLEYAKSNRNKFNTFREMVLVFDDYIDTLAEGSRPSPRNYVTNLQKIGSCLGIWKYSSLFK